MKPLRIFGLCLLVLLWFWLVRSLILYGGGFNLKNLFLTVSSAIIIFLPLYKKWKRENQ